MPAVGHKINCWQKYVNTSEKGREGASKPETKREREREHVVCRPTMSLQQVVIMVDSFVCACLRANVRVRELLCVFVWLYVLVSDVYVCVCTVVLIMTL